jgi:hypothetical protein
MEGKEGQLQRFFSTSDSYGLFCVIGLVLYVCRLIPSDCDFGSFKWAHLSGFIMKITTKVPRSMAHHLSRLQIIDLSKTVTVIARSSSSVENVPASSPSSPIIELCTGCVQPDAIGKYVRKLSQQSKLRVSDPRLQHQQQLRILSITETGAGSLDTVTTVSYYEGGYAEFEASRSSLATWQEGQKITDSMNKYLRHRSSTIWVEAPFIQKLQQQQQQQTHPVVLGLAYAPDPNTQWLGDSPILEYRRYNLIVGYDTVPEFYNWYETGLTAKLKHQDPSTSLVSVLHTEVGRLNQVLEIWRHGDGATAMQKSRHAARTNAPEWRDAIAKIADHLALDFECTIQKPLSPSPIR